MAPSAKLRIIFGEDDVRKLLLPAGIPSTLQDLNDVLRGTFDITGPFTVMYQDMDFDDESGPSYRSKPWPFKFEIPDFSYDIDLALEAGKQAYENHGTLLNNPSVTSSILEKLAETIFGCTAYPTGVQILAVAEALVEKYPCLKEPGSFNGLYGWQQRIKYKMGNYRAKLRGRQLAIPELEVNTLKRRCSSEEGSLKGFKRAKKAEVNYLPPLPFGETEETLEKERLDLLKEIKKKNNERAINEKMEKSFAMRRTEVVKDCPAIQDLLERWPSLFCENQIKEEFKRITTIHLERMFLSRLDGYTTKLLEIFRRKGGTAGTKIKPMLDSLNEFSAPVFPPWGPSTLGVVLVYQHGCRPMDSSSLGGWRALHLCVEPLVCPGQGGHCVGTPCGRGR
ncbi:sterile alpha motif domain-containing 3-like isoform X1 [Labeo rohita]|uniref:Sterile alpha motif domain-containing 3-like isoform X1 n=1 Tax=Labeo rohita TaxID=84645 RepID=A0A498MEE4_LABRO|nr:sterile alpha motif domain-containing 3-like isoform X1 [Labeo rohita]